MSKRMSAARARGAMDAAVDVAVDALVGMSQTPVNESAIIEGGGEDSQAGPSAPSTGHKGHSGRHTLTAEERER